MKNFFQILKIIFNFIKKIRRLIFIFYFIKNKIKIILESNLFKTILKKIKNKISLLKAKWEPLFKRNSYVSIWANIKKKFFN